MITINPLCRKSTLAVSLALALVACDGNGSQQNTNSSPEPGKPEPSQEQTRVVPKLDTKAQIAFSREDLAARRGIEPDAVSLSGATPVSWRSGALGCPEPGMNYTEALVPGIWIMLRVGKTLYRYHGVPGGQPFYCPDERAEAPVMGSGAD